MHLNGSVTLTPRESTAGFTTKGLLRSEYRFLKDKEEEASKIKSRLLYQRKKEEHDVRRVKQEEALRASIQERVQQRQRMTAEFCKALQLFPQHCKEQQDTLKKQKAAEVRAVQTARAHLEAVKKEDVRELRAEFKVKENHKKEMVAQEQAQKYQAAATLKRERREANLLSERQRVETRKAVADEMREGLKADFVGMRQLTEFEAARKTKICEDTRGHRSVAAEKRAEALYKKCCAARDKVRRDLETTMTERVLFESTLSDLKWSQMEVDQVEANRSLRHRKEGQQKEAFTTRMVRREETPPDDTLFLSREPEPEALWLLPPPAPPAPKKPEIPLPPRSGTPVPDLQPHTSKQGSSWRRVRRPTPIPRLTASMGVMLGLDLEDSL